MDYFITFIANNIQLFWVFLTVLSLILEIITVSFYIGFYAVGTLLALALSYFNLSFNLQISVFIIVPNILFLLFYKFRDFFGISQKTFTRTNLDRVIGKEGYVVSTLNWLQAGAIVKVDGKEWTAISSNGQSLIKGQIVKVKSLEGVKLIVEVI